jgi:hypothetical protein
VEDDLMSNGVAKPSEFDAATKVMESGLLRVLKSETSDLDELAPPTQPEVAATAPPDPTPAPPVRRSRIFVVAGLVAAVVLAFDASLVLFHPRRETPPPAVIAAPDPMPKYMLVPLDAPPPPAAAEPAVAPAPPTTTVVATATTERPVLAVRSHRRSRHRHASH